MTQGRLRAFGLLLHSLSRSLLLMASKTVKEHFQQSVLQIHSMPLNILGEGTDRGRQRMRTRMLLHCRGVSDRNAV